MTTADEEIARTLADIKRRLAAVERTAQAPHTSIEGGSLTINRPDGLPAIVMGDLGDGTYGVVGYNDAAVHANTVPQELLDEIAGDLELAEESVTEAMLAVGAVTETKIADDAISSPKIVAGAIQAGHIAAGSIATDKLVAQAVTADKIAANAITADKVAATAIDGKTITGATLIVPGPDGSRVRILNDPEAGAVVELRPQDSGDAVILPAVLRSATDPNTDEVSAALVGPNINGNGSASMHMSSDEHGGTVSIESGHFWLNATNGVTWAVDGDWEIAYPDPDDPGTWEVRFHVANGGKLTAPSAVLGNGHDDEDGPALDVYGVVEADELKVYDRAEVDDLTVTGDAEVAGSLSAGSADVAGVLTAGQLRTGGFRQRTWSTRVTITPVANTPTMLRVNFPAGFFTTSANIAVTVSPLTNAPGTTVTGCSATNISTTGCDVWITRINGTATGVSVIATEL
ncbi:hypothetical protein [Micromonospora sp. WMMD1082]|uniref:hypothetical protein n=1 Tax=Micromonospora sp. WMMD1082 TaxID=3016104 RepID=UPI0024169A4C|nr:hypothetical protein [Micromonospora sp. WMMD1082]MDG4792707.1 hypothetical protein [Micromonospora sp. WMMD1082]